VTLGKIECVSCSEALGLIEAGLLEPHEFAIVVLRMDDGDGGSEHGVRRCNVDVGRESVVS
jgi:hypothetical protein